MQALQDELLETSQETTCLQATFFHVVVGRESILDLRSVLIPFSERCEQPGTMEDLSYFLSKPGLLHRVPQLYLIVKRGGLRTEDISVNDLAGVALFYEYEVCSFGTGLFATNDRSGRGTLLAPKRERSRVAMHVSRIMIDRGAHAILLSYQGDEAAEQPLAPTELYGSGRSSRSALAAVRTRILDAYLPLHSTYDETLATLGQKTRRNLRYYRRRAEAQLGCRFISDVEISEADLVRFNAETMFAVSDRDALWRLRTQKELASPLLMGLKDGEGKWLSILAGRRHKSSTEILWQMNRKDLPSHSLSTVMRSYCIEHEIALGARRLYLEGGTGHSIHHSFKPESLIDLAVVRNPMWAWTIRKLSHKFVSPDNVLATMLNSSEVAWSRC